jgi:LPS-assembly protein
VLPLLNFRHDFADKAFGGDARIDANFAWLQRASGVDSQRLTVGAFWEREHITAGGHRLGAFAELRSDAWYFHDLQEGTEILPGAPDDRRRIDARFAPSVGVEWSYPLTRRVGGARLFVEPRIQLVASPTNRNTSDIINEDSQSIEYDYAGLFDFNKSTGFDRFEDGQRMNIGVAVAAEFDAGLAVEGAIGAQGRLQKTNAFDPSTGLGEERSDFVGEFNVRYKTLLSVENRFRLDDDSGDLQRAESLAAFNIWRLSGFLSYVRLNEENIAAELVRREELTGNMRVKLTDHWSTGFAWREDLESSRTISQDFLIGYVDECASFDVIFRRDFTRDIGLRPDNSVFVRFTLKSLVD